MITSLQQQPTGSGTRIARRQKQASKVLALFLLAVLFVSGMFKNRSSLSLGAEDSGTFQKAALKRKISAISQLSVMIGSDANAARSSTVGLQPQLKHRQNPTPTASVINDKTLHWDVHVVRPCLRQDLKNENKPRVEIPLTNIGWNHPNQTCALTNHPRSLREWSLMEGVVSHHWFHPAGWDDVESGGTPVREGICHCVFFDEFQCLDHHWPKCGGSQQDNVDNHDNRTIQGDQNCWRMTTCPDACMCACQLPSGVLQWNAQSVCLLH